MADKNKKNAAERKAKAEADKQVHAHVKTLDDLKMYCKIADNERKFYLGKLLQIEKLCKAHPNDHPIIPRVMRSATKGLSYSKDAKGGNEPGSSDQH